MWSDMAVKAIYSEERLKQLVKMFGDKIIPEIELVCFVDRSTVEDSGWSNSPVLNDIVDIDFALEYKYNTIFSAYFELKNLIGNYQIWENYPVLGPQVFFGLSYRL